jgi:MFS family permease
MSLATTGSAIGGFLITPLVAWIVLNESWRTAALLSGGLILLAGLPLAMLVRMPRGDEAAPEDAMGLVRTDRHGRTLPSDSGVEFTVRQAVRTRTFWFLAVAIGIRLMAQSALTVHFVPMLVSRGVGEGTAAVLVSVHAVTRLPAVVLGGLVADRWSRSKTSAVAMLLGVSASVFITPGPGGIATGVIFAMLFACAEATNTVTWALIGQYFGRKNFATLRGIVTTLQSALSFLGPIAAGFIYDSTDSYRAAFMAIAVSYILAAVLFWTMRPAAPSKPAGGHSGLASPVEGASTPS